MPRPEQLLDRARSAASAGRHAQAARYLDLAAEANAEQDLAARVEVTRAYVLCETGRLPEAVEVCLGVLARPELQGTVRGKAWQQLGLIRMRAGEADDALDAFAQAIALLPARELDQGLGLLNRGNVYLQQGRAREAARDFEGARKILGAVGDPVERAKAEHNLGYTRLLRGELIEALRAMESAATVLAPLSPVSRAVGEQDRAEVLLASGRPQEAVRALEAAAAAYGSRRLRTFQAECELTLAGTLLRQDPQRARVVARRSARRFRSQASPARALRADATALSAEIAAGARSPSVLARAQELSAQLRAQGVDADATVLELLAGRVAVRRDELDRARQVLRSIRVHTSTPLPTRLLSREVRAELASARGDPVRARGHVRAGLAELHEWQSSFGSLDLQSTLVGHGRDLARMGLELGLDTGEPTTVFEWSERARALAGRVTPVRPPPDEQLAEDLTELRLLRPGDDARAQELRRRVRQRQWYAAGPGAVDEPAALADLCTALEEDDAVLVAHLVVRERVTALVVGPEGSSLVDAGPLQPLRDRLDALTADLTMAAAHRDDALAVPLRAALRARLATVSEQLVAPLLDRLGNGRVVLTPSGSLAGTPWSLLPGMTGRPLTIPPSATRWLGMRGAPTPHAVGLVAGPGVARGEEEVSRAAAAWWDAELLFGTDATSDRVSGVGVTRRRAAPGRARPAHA